MRLVSIQQKVEKLRSLTPHDLNNWERGFQASIERLALANQLSHLTEPQLDMLDRLYEKHFG
jgi:hypothetical protein